MPIKIESNSEDFYPSTGGGGGVTTTVVNSSAGNVTKLAAPVNSVTVAFDPAYVLDKAAYKSLYGSDPDYYPAEYVTYPGQTVPSTTDIVIGKGKTVLLLSTLLPAGSNYLLTLPALIPNNSDFELLIIKTNNSFDVEMIGLYGPYGSGNTIVTDDVFTIMPDVGIGYGYYKLSGSTKLNAPDRVTKLYAPIASSVTLVQDVNFAISVYNVDFIDQNPFDVTLPLTIPNGKTFIKIQQGSTFPYTINVPDLSNTSLEWEIEVIKDEGVPLDSPVIITGTNNVFGFMNSDGTMSSNVTTNTRSFTITYLTTNNYNDTGYCVVKENFLPDWVSNTIIISKTYITLWVGDYYISFSDFPSINTGGPIYTPFSTWYPPTDVTISNPVIPNTGVTVKKDAYVNVYTGVTSVTIDPTTTGEDTFITFIGKGVQLNTNPNPVYLTLAIGHNLILPNGVTLIGSGLPDPAGPDLSKLGSINKFIYDGFNWTLLSNDSKFVTQSSYLTMSYVGPLVINTGLSRHYHPKPITLTEIYFSVAVPSATLVDATGVAIKKSLVAELCINGVPILATGLNPFTGPNEFISNKVVLNQVVLPTDYLTLNIITAVLGSENLTATISYN